MLLIISRFLCTNSLFLFFLCSTSARLTLWSHLCLSPQSLFLADISPPAQGVDHRHVQKELGNVMVRLHNPVVLGPTTIQVTWTVRAAKNSSGRLNCVYLRLVYLLPFILFTPSVVTTKLTADEGSSPRLPFVLCQEILFRVFLKKAALGIL